MNGSTVGKWIIFVGLVVVALGIVIWVVSKLGFPVGKLPGDINVQKEKIRFYFPLATSLILSLILTILVNLIVWLFRK